MLVVPLLYLLAGLLYAALRARAADPRAKDVVEVAIMIIFWPMHVVASDAPLPRAADDTPVSRLEEWLVRFADVSELRSRLLDARAWAETAMAKGTPQHEIWRLLRPLLDECESKQQHL